MFDSQDLDLMFVVLVYYQRFMNGLINKDFSRKANQVEVKGIKKRERSFWYYHINLYELVSQL